MEVETYIKKPSVFEYRDYRLFLKDLYDHYKRTTDFFSFRYFSKRAGFKSPNYLKLVIEGKRNISPESIEKFSFALKLSQDESDFFAKLVNFNQAQTNSEKAEFALQLMQSKIYKKMNPLKEEQMRYYSQWYHIGIRELSLCQGFIEDPQWIGEQFTPQITSDKAGTAVDSLLQLGLLGRDSEGKLLPTNQNVATHDEVSSSLVTLFHKQMMDKAKDSLDLFAGKEREISSVSIPLSEETFHKIKSRIQDFRKELIAIASEDKTPDRVYQLNFQLFPLTKRRDS